MLGVLWPALDAECQTFATVPKGTGFVAKESSTDSSEGRIVAVDIAEHVSVLDVFREGDSLFAALPLQNDIFGELHDTRRVSP